MRLTLPISALLVLLLACSPTGVDDLRQEQDDPPGVPAYATHAVAYGSSLAQIDQRRLAVYDLLVLEASCFDQLEAHLRDRALLYFNPWGKSSYTDSLRDWPEWQPAPGEMGEADVVLNETVHCYRFDDAHVVRFLGWIEDFLQEHGGEVAGVFLDDFSYDRNWWEGAEADRDSVWGPYDGGPGWREAPYDWNRGRIAALEAGARALVLEYCGADGELVLNGVARTLPGVRRFAEDVGAPDSEAWDRLEQDGVDPLRYVRPGDLLQVNGIGASGEWGDWAQSEAGDGLANLQRAAALAVARGASVGLAYGVVPPSGSVYSLFLAPDAAGEEWPGYFDPSP